MEKKKKKEAFICYYDIHIGDKIDIITCMHGSRLCYIVPLELQWVLDSKKVHFQTAKEHPSPITFTNMGSQKNVRYKKTKGSYIICSYKMLIIQGSSK